MQIGEEHHHAADGYDCNGNSLGGSSCECSGTSDYTCSGNTATFCDGCNYTVDMVDKCMNEGWHNPQFCFLMPSCTGDGALLNPCC